MKKFYSTALMILFTTVVSFSQNYQDVVYLKNGSIIHGIIIEQVPNQSLKIQTRDGNVFVYNMTDVEKMTKEPVKSNYGYNYGNASDNSAYKNPLIALGFSTLLPGIGQFYNEQYFKGSIMLGLDAIGFFSFATASTYPNKNKTFIHVCIAGIAANYLWSMIDAPLTARHLNSINGLSLNISKDCTLALRPDYDCSFIGNKEISTFGAKISLNIK